MKQAITTQVTKTLKTMMKKKKMTYWDLSQRLRISESTVKRFFQGENVTIERLNQFCEVIGLSLFTLFELAHSNAEIKLSLTVDQENSLVTHDAAYFVFTHLLSGDTVPSVMERYKLKDIEMTKILKDLEKFGLIERYQGWGIRLKVKGTLTWLKNGPLQKKWMHQRHLDLLVKMERLETTSYLTSSNVTFAKSTWEEMTQDMASLAERYIKKAVQDSQTLPEADLMHCGWIMGVARAPDYAHEAITRWRSGK